MPRGRGRAAILPGRECRRCDGARIASRLRRRCRDACRAGSRDPLPLAAGGLFCRSVPASACLFPEARGSGGSARIGTDQLRCGQDPVGLGSGHAHARLGGKGWQVDGRMRREDGLDRLAAPGAPLGVRRNGGVLGRLPGQRELLSIASIWAPATRACGISARANFTACGRPGRVVTTAIGGIGAAGLRLDSPLRRACCVSPAAAGRGPASPQVGGLRRLRSRARAWGPTRPVSNVSHTSAAKGVWRRQRPVWRTPAQRWPARK